MPSDHLLRAAGKRPDALSDKAVIDLTCLVSRVP